MKNTSVEFKNVAESFDGSALYHTQIISNGTEITDEILDFKYSTMCNNTSRFTFGNTASAIVEFTIHNPSVDITDTELIVKQGLKTSDDTIEYITLGVFKVLTPERDRDMYTYKCVDKMTYLLNVKYDSQLTYPTTDIEILNEICTMAGITLANDVLVSHTIDKKLDNYTMREMIGIIAQLQGKNAIINQDGELQLIWYAPVDYEVSDNRIYADKTSIINSETDYVLGYIECYSGSKSIRSGDGATGTTISNPYMTQEILDEVFAKIGGFTFRSVNVDFYGDFRLEVGDIVTMVTNGETYVVPIMSLEQNSDGGVITTIESIGESDTENYTDTNGNLANQLKRSVVSADTARSIAEQSADKINFVVEGDSVSEFTVTDNVIQATTEKLVIKTDKGGEVVIENGIMYVNDIFAEEITATGTITGAKLYGASGEFEGDLASYGTITLYTGEWRTKPEGGSEFVKDAGKLVLKTNYSPVTTGAPLDHITLTISSNVDRNNSTILQFNKMHKIEFINDGEDSPIIQFGKGGTTGTEQTSLVVKPEFNYVVGKGPIYGYEPIPSPHLERLMLDSVAIENNYTENLYATESAKMPFLSKGDGNTHVVLANNEGSLTVSSITSTEVYRLLGVTSNVQTQFDNITNTLKKDYVNNNNSGNSIAMTSGTAKNMLTITLDAGCWLVVGGVRYTPADSSATLTKTELCISTTTNFTTAPTQYVKHAESNTVNENAALNLITVFNPTAQTTYYLNGRVYASGSGTATINALPRIFAVRIPYV